MIWEDLFKAAAVTVLREQDMTGVEVPDSNFVQTPDLASTRSMVADLAAPQRTPATGGGTGAGLHGTSIVGTQAQPGGQQLSTRTENTIVASTDLAFEVGVRNGGDNQEVKIDVTLDDPAEPDAGGRRSRRST